MPIFSKRAREIVRHHQAETHLRKDKRWRYEHPRKVDRIIGLVSHEVRGKDGLVLTALESEKEKRYFEHVTLMEIDDKHPFYDDYVTGLNSFIEQKKCAYVRRFPR